MFSRLWRVLRFFYKKSSIKIALLFLLVFYFLLFKTKYGELNKFRVHLLKKPFAPNIISGEVPYSTTTTEAVDNLDQFSQNDAANANLTNIKNKYPIDFEYIRNTPLLFIGGFGRSGTTLMRAILDVHPNIRCGPETKILPSLLSHLSKYLKSQGVQNDLREAGVSSKLIDYSLSAFVYNIVVARETKNVNVRHHCSKDPNILYYIKSLHSMFPKAKFIHLIRDGRAASYSFLLKIKEKPNFKNFKSTINIWNNYNRFVDDQCRSMGAAYCLQIRYEDMITNTEAKLRQVMVFLNESWTDELLKHDKHIGKDIAVSNLEWSSDQIKKPINNGSLVPQWMGKIPGYDATVISRAVPMLRRFGYSQKINNKFQRKNINKQ